MSQTPEGNVAFFSFRSECTTRRITMKRWILLRYSKFMLFYNTSRIPSIQYERTAWGLCSKLEKSPRRCARYAFRILTLLLFRFYDTAEPCQNNVRRDRYDRRG